MGNVDTQTYSLHFTNDKQTDKHQRNKLEGAGDSSVIEQRQTRHTNLCRSACKCSEFEKTCGGKRERWEGREGRERRGETLEGRGEEWRVGEERAPVSSLQHTTVRHCPSTSNYLHITY